MFAKILASIIFLQLFFSSSEITTLPKLAFDLSQVANKELKFDTDFGLVVSKYNAGEDGCEFINEGDGFLYRQKLIEDNDSIYVLETEQKLDLFLFVSKSSFVTYGKPLLRFPKYLTLDSKWKWEGIEYFDEGNDSSYSTITGKVLKLDTLEIDGDLLSTWVVETKVKNSESDNIVTEWISPEFGIVKSKIQINGGGFTGFIRDFLGYGDIEFELISKNSD